MPSAITCNKTRPYGLYFFRFLNKNNMHTNNILIGMEHKHRRNSIEVKRDMYGINIYIEVFALLNSV